MTPRPPKRRIGNKPALKNVYRRPTAAPMLDPHCGMKAKCGACEFVNLPYELGLKEKHRRGAEILEKTGLVPKSRILPPVKAPRPYEFRSLFKLAVRPAPASERPAAPTHPDDPAAPVAPRFAIGLFEPGSHTVVDMDDCPLHVVPLKRLIKDLREELNQSPLTPYDEATGTGQVRYLAARAAHLTNEIMVTFVVTEPLKVELRRIVEKLQRRGHKINSAHLNLNTERGNAIFGKETIRVAGADGLRERVCDLDFEVGPTSFFQINPWQAINLYRRIEQVVGAAGTPGTPAWDLYCGIGQISLVLARLGYKTLGIEENPEAVKDATANARRNRLENNAEFLAARVEDATTKIPRWAQQPSLIVANPSRRGLHEATRQHLAMTLVSNPDARFVYVSCNVETLARDLTALASTGYVVRQAEAFDMFPQTDDMEWLVVLTR